MKKLLIRLSVIPFIPITGVFFFASFFMWIFTGRSFEIDDVSFMNKWASAIFPWWNDGEKQAEPEPKRKNKKRYNKSNNK